MIISEEIRNEIATSLEGIAREENVTIFYACESGSRAWGFPSADSDYDVRFLYAHPPEWYLSIDVEKKRDVIERPISDDLDISGWDLRKALGLLYKSNPPLLEWLSSPIVYREEGPIAARLRETIPTYYNRRRAFFHYLHMARGNNRNYLQGDVIRAKKYFYVLRPLLALRWIESHDDPVPIEFEELLDGLLEPGTLRDAIDQLLVEKRSGAELESRPRIPAISDYIDAELIRLENQIEVPGVQNEIEELNRFFRESLATLYPTR